MSKNFERYYSIIFFVTVAFIAMVSRWLPHPPNFTAMSGFFFVSGMLAVRHKWIILAAFAPMIISDVLLETYPGLEFVYVGHLVVLLAGLWFGSRFARQYLPFFVFNLSSALIFFVLSNLGVWWSAGIYPRTSAGLVECFLMALPFFHQNVLAQLVFAGVFVAGFYWVASKVLASQQQQQS